MIRVTRRPPSSAAYRRNRTATPGADAPVEQLTGTLEQIISVDRFGPDEVAALFTDLDLRLSLSTACLPHRPMGDEVNANVRFR